MDNTNGQIWYLFSHTWHIFLILNVLIVMILINLKHIFVEAYQ